MFCPNACNDVSVHRLPNYSRIVPWVATLLISCSVAVATGCTPRVIIRQSPDAHDQGIRYYRPKPYLLVTPLSKDTDAATNAVSIKLEYLPDFTEEYSIDVRPGLGVADVSVELKDGWNLVSINQKLDSQTDENIKAAADLLKSAASLPASGAAKQTMHEVRVPASNVPLGYYEAVIGRNRQGKKQLFGFRYVGFMPFQSCPTELCGSSKACCDDGMLYGLVFDSGVMKFKVLGEIASLAPIAEQAEITQQQSLVPAVRNFSRSYTNKGGKEDSSVTIQDTGSLPIVVPYSEIIRPAQQ